MSVGDWEFKLLSNWSDCTTWYLDDTEYVSAPSCLLLPMPAGTNDYNLAVYNGSNKDLPEGRVDFWLRNSVGVYTTQTKIFLGVTDAGAYAIATDYISATTTWIHFRVTWWYAYDYQNKPSTRVKVEQWVADEWSQISETDYPPLPSTNCRYAHGVRKYASRSPARLDDCSIYKGVE